MWANQDKLRMIFASASHVDPFELVRADTNGISSSIRDVVGSDHPIMRTVAGYFFESNTNRTRPTLLFLLARAISNTGFTATAAREALLAATANNSSASSSNSVGSSAKGMSAVSDRQRMLAEITELIHVAGVLHNNVPDTAPGDQSCVGIAVPKIRTASGPAQSLSALASTAGIITTANTNSANAATETVSASANATAAPPAAAAAPAAATAATAVTATANKTLHLAQSFTGKKLVLGGDLLFSRAVVGLHQLHSHYVTGLVSRAIEHAVEGEVMASKDTAATVQWWETKAFLSSASLLAHTAQATAVLGKGDAAVQRLAFDLGKYLGLVAQSMDDVRAYRAALPKHLTPPGDVTEPLFEAFEALHANSGSGGSGSGSGVNATRVGSSVFASAGSGGSSAGNASVNIGVTPSRKRSLMNYLSYVLPKPLRMLVASRLAPKTSIEEILNNNSNNNNSSSKNTNYIDAAAAAIGTSTPQQQPGWPLFALSRVPASSKSIPSPSRVVSTATTLLYAAAPAPPLPDTAGLVFVLAAALDPAVLPLAAAA